MALNSDIILTLEQENRLTQIVNRNEPMIDIVNKNKNSSYEETEHTKMVSVKEVRVDIECDDHKMAIEETILTPLPLRDVLVSADNTTNKAILYILILKK